jgi:hypothetical protein
MAALSGKGANSVPPAAVALITEALASAISAVGGLPAHPLNSITAAKPEPMQPILFENRHGLLIFMIVYPLS